MKKYFFIILGIILLVIVGVVFRKRIAINFNDLTEIKVTKYLDRLNDGNYQTESKVLTKEQYQELLFDIQWITTKVRKPDSKKDLQNINFKDFYEYRFVTDKHELILKFDLVNEETAENIIYIYYKEIDNENYQIYIYKNHFIKQLLHLQKFYDEN